MADEAAARGVADGVGRGAVVDPGRHRGQLLGRELAEGDARTGPRRGAGTARRGRRPGRRRRTRSPRAPARPASASRTTPSGSSVDGQPRRGARQPLGGRGGADARRPPPAARTAARRSARSPSTVGGVDRGQRLDVDHADDLAGDAQRKADLGAHAGDRAAGSPGASPTSSTTAGSPVRKTRPTTPAARGQPVVDLPARRARPGSAGGRPGRGRSSAAGRGGRGGRRPPRTRRAPCTARSRSRSSRPLAAARRAGHRSGRDVAPATPRRGGRTASPGRSRSPSRAAPRAPRRARRPRRRRARRPRARTPRSRAARPRGSRRASTPATIPRESLRKSGRIVGDVLQRREAGARVVDRDQRAAGDPRPQPLAQQRVVEHRVLLGQLDHEPRRQLAGELEQPRMAERLRRQVHPQQPPVRRDAGGGDRAPAGDLEVVAQPGAGRGGERHVGRQRDQAGRRGEARQALVADRAQVRRAGRSAGTRRGSRPVPAERESRQPRPMLPGDRPGSARLERSGIRLACRRRPPPAGGRPRPGAASATSAMMRLDVLALEHLLAQQGAGELVELRAVSVEQLHRAAHRLVGEVLLLGVAQLARAVGDRAALGGQLQRADRRAHRPLVDHLPRDLGDLLEVVRRAGGDAAEDQLLRRAAAEQDRHAGRSARPGS